MQEETQITMPPNNELSMRAVIRDNGNLLYNVVGSATRVTMLLLLFVDGTSAICPSLFRLPLLLRFTSLRPILDIKLASRSGEINVMTRGEFHAQTILTEIRTISLFGCRLTFSNFATAGYSIVQRGIGRTQRCMRGENTE